MNATKATVANAAAISSKITATANNHSDFPDHASNENKRFVEAINIPETKKQLDETATSELDSLIKYVIKDSPEIAQIHAIQGDFNYLIGNKKEALKSFKNTIALDASHYAVWNEIFVIEEELVPSNFQFFG